MQFEFLRCVGRATARHASRALQMDRPFGETAFPLVQETWEKWNQQHRTAEERWAELEALTQASVQEIRRQAEQVVLEIEPTKVRAKLTDFLERLPSFIRRSLVRSADVNGLQPTKHLLEKPEDLMLFLPPRPLRFKSGDQPLGVDGLMLDELLGVGGFGEVWKARHPFLEESLPVALKFSFNDEKGVRNLEHEVTLNRLMRENPHPGIVKLRLYDLKSNPPWLEYEYVEGGDLTQLIRAWANSPPEDLVQRSVKLMYEIATIIAFCHRLEPPIAHRDLKPANILLQPTGSGFQPRVTDFGIGTVAVSEAERQLRRTLMRGLTRRLEEARTELYAPPDPQEGPEATRDDVYALGVIWYQMLIGDTQRKPEHGFEKPLERRKIPGNIIQLLGRCVALEATERLANAAFLTEELTKLLPLSERSTFAATTPAPPKRLPVTAPSKPAPPKLTPRSKSQQTQQKGSPCKGCGTYPATWHPTTCPDCGYTRWHVIAILVAISISCGFVGLIGGIKWGDNSAWFWLPGSILFCVAAALIHHSRETLKLVNKGLPLKAYLWIMVGVAVPFIILLFTLSLVFNLRVDSSPPIIPRSGAQPRPLGPG